MLFACLMDVTVEYLSQQWYRRFGTPNSQLQFSMWHTTVKEMLIHYNKFDIYVTVHHDKFLILKLDAPISQINLEWNSTCFRQFPCPSSGVFHCTHSNGICHTGLQFHPDPARKLSANLYDIYHCCVYSEKLLMMDRGTVRNM